MRDEMPQKLPRYVFCRANGSYRYKRNVPKRLRQLICNDTLYRQFCESYSEAMKALPKVHSEIEGLFEVEETMPTKDRALALIRAALGQEVAELVIAGEIKECSLQDYELNDLARSLVGELPEEVERQVFQGKLQSPPVTLDTALSKYAAYKAREGARDKDAALRIKKLRKDLKSCLGGHKLERRGLADIARADANAFRDHLLERMKPNSVLRNVAVVKAAVNYVIVKQSLSMPNVFNRLRIKGAGGPRR